MDKFNYVRENVSAQTLTGMAAVGANYHGSVNLVYHRYLSRRPSFCALFFVFDSL